MYYRIDDDEPTFSDKSYDRLELTADQMKDLEKGKLDKQTPGEITVTVHVTESFK